MSKTHSTTNDGTVGNPAENHNRINDEAELHDWNVKLSSDDLCAQYVQYFTRIIPPNSYAQKGDNACYTIVDCLFTRELWTRFTWTGISRGQKSRRGFREFGNVLQLLLKLVRIGDPTYCSQKLEAFCRNRLFRYSKSRSSNKQLRRSACRPTRKQKGGNNDLQNDELSSVQKNEDTEKIYFYNATQFDNNIDEVEQVVEVTTGYYADDSGSDNDTVDEEGTDSTEAMSN